MLKEQTLRFVEEHKDKLIFDELVGRSTDIENLEMAVGKNDLVFLTGIGGGSGKSSLVAALVENYLESGISVLV